MLHICIIQLTAYSLQLRHALPDDEEIRRCLAENSPFLIPDFRLADQGFPAIVQDMSRCCQMRPLTGRLEKEAVHGLGYHLLVHRQAGGSHGSIRQAHQRTAMSYVIKVGQLFLRLHGQGYTPPLHALHLDAQ